MTVWEQVFHSAAFTWCNWGLAVVLTILFFVYAFSKEGRDEHGRAVLGTACFCGVIGLIVFMNLLSYFMYDIMESPAVFANAIRLVYVGFLLVTMVSVGILRKLR